MKPPKTQLRREFAFVAGVTLLALAPLAYLWRKSVLAQRKNAGIGVVFPTYPQVQNAYAFGEATISPDGRFFARMESAASQMGGTLSRNSLSPVANQIVIHSTQNGQEIFRATSSGEFMSWTPSSNFVARNGDDLNVFSLSQGSSGSSTPSWKRRKLTFSPDPGGMSTSFGANGATQLSLQTGAIDLSPDGRFAVKGSWGKGTIVWQVADLKTNTVMAPVQAGRWLNYDPKVSAFSNNISITVAPAHLASGTRPVVAVLQTTRIRRLSLPTPTSTPFPTPRPTPTFSPAQLQFNTKEAQEEAKIQKLVDSVLGVDGSDPEVTDEAEVKRIEAEVKRRNHALAAQRQKFFPSPTPSPQIRAAQWALTEPFQVETFDLSTGKRLWSASLKANVFSPHIQFSPDGSTLVASRTAAKSRRMDMLDGTGLEFRSARTGQLIGKADLFEERFGTPDHNRQVFYNPSSSGRKNPSAVLAIKDVSTETSHGKSNNFGRRTVFRLFDASTAREIAYLKLDPLQSSDQQDFQNFSTSQDGKQWLWGTRAVQVLSRDELGQEVPGPLPTPTPYPIRVR